MGKKEKKTFDLGSGMKVKIYSPTRVWIKQRKNPPKKDGTRTVSHTLQWLDDDGTELYHSLGSGITKEEAERQREEFQDRLNSSMRGSCFQEDAEIEVLRLRKELPEDYKTLVEAYGKDPRSWGIWNVTWQEGDKVLPWTCKRLSRIAAMLRGEAGVNYPPYVRFQLCWQAPEAHHQLYDYFTSQEAFEAEIQKRLEALPEGDKLNSKVVISDLLVFAEEIAWSHDPERFEEQFQERYPNEYEKLQSEELSPARYLTLNKQPPLKVAEQLLKYAHGEIEEKPVKVPRPKVFWQASEEVERRGTHGDRGFVGDEKSVGNELDFGEQRDN